MSDYKNINCEEEGKEFKMRKTLCFGLDDSGREYFPYTLPVSVRDYEEIKEKIEKIRKKYKCENIFYGDCLNLKLKNISNLQREELYEKGYKYVYEKFSVIGVTENLKNKKRYLNFKVENLKKVGDFKNFPKDESSDSE